MYDVLILIYFPGSGQLLTKSKGLYVYLVRALVRHLAPWYALQVLTWQQLSGSWQHAPRFLPAGIVYLVTVYQLIH